MGNRAFNGENLRGERVNGTAPTIPSRPAAVPNSSNVRPSAGAHTALINEISAQLRTMPTNRHNENDTPAAVSNSSNVQPSPSVSQPSDPSSIMDEIMAELRSLPSDLNVEDAPGEVSMDEIIAQLRTFPSHMQNGNNTPASVSNSSNVQSSAGVSRPSDHTSFIDGICAELRTTPRNRQNENTKPAAVSNASSVQPSPGVSRPSDPTSVMDGIMAQLRALPSGIENKRDTPSGLHMGKSLISMPCNLY